MGMNRFKPGFVAALLVMILVVPPAAAQQPAQKELGVGKPRPWAEGISEERQRAADALFQEGNGYLDNSLFLKAAEKFREALGYWDHPAIHYNLSLALVNLGQPLELHRHLVKAMQYDEKPLDHEKIERARFFKKLVEQQLSHLDISCDVTGAVVRMDEQVLFTAPGHFKEWVLPGEHKITVTKEGYPPNERYRPSKGGERIALHIRQLYKEEELRRHSRPWPVWKPLAVLGTGAALTLGGGLLHLRARDSYRDFDARAAVCGPAGCEPGLGHLKLRTRGASLQRAAWISYGVGGAMFATGAVLAFINRTHSYSVSPDQHEQSLGVSLQVNGHSRGVLAMFRF